MASAERGKRAAQNERDELSEELSTANLSKNSFMDEKKRLEARVNAIEDEMEEEASNAELAVEKARKLQSQVMDGQSVTTVAADVLVRHNNKSRLCCMYGYISIPTVNINTPTIYITTPTLAYVIHIYKITHVHKYAYCLHKHMNILLYT